MRKYEESVAEEQDVPIDKVEQIYNEAGLVFSDSVTENLSKVMDFHRKVIENRKDYLQSETATISC